MHNGQEPTKQQVADTILATAIIAGNQREEEHAKKLMLEFAGDRNDELARLSREVIRPHMRSWAKEWFEKHGLKLPPYLGGEDEPIVFAG